MSSTRAGASTLLRRVIRGDAGGKAATRPISDPRLISRRELTDGNLPPSAQCVAETSHEPARRVFVQTSWRS